MGRKCYSYTVECPYITKHFLFIWATKWLMLISGLDKAGSAGAKWQFAPRHFLTVGRHFPIKPESACGLTMCLRSRHPSTICQGRSTSHSQKTVVCSDGTMSLIASLRWVVKECLYVLKKLFLAFEIWHNFSPKPPWMQINKMYAFQ